VSAVEGESQVAILGRIHAEIDPQVVRSPALLARQPGQRGRVAVAVETVADRIEILQRRHALRFAADRCGVDRIARIHAAGFREIFRIYVAQAIEAHVGQARSDFLRGRDGVAPRNVLRFRKR
jgi:hypothetical protein